MRASNLKLSLLLMLGVVLALAVHAQAQPDCDPEWMECDPGDGPDPEPSPRTEPCDPTWEACTGGAPGSGGSTAGGTASGGSFSGGAASNDSSSGGDPSGGANSGGDGLKLDPILEQVVDSQVDMVEQRPLFAYAHPFYVAGGARWTEGGGWLGGGEIGTVGLRNGKLWGMSRLFPVDVTVWSHPSRGALVSTDVALLVVDGVYFCHNEGGPNFIPLPFYDIWPTPGHACRAREWLGYYGSLLDFSFQPASAHVAARLVELGLLANVLRSGRTDAVQRNRLVFRLGATVEYVDAGSAMRPATAASSTALGRGEVGLDLSIGTNDRRVRFGAKGLFLPRLGVWDDYQGEGEAWLSVYFPLEIVSALELSAYAKASYASFPWMNVNHWADLNEPWNLQPGLRLALYWYEGR